MFIIIEAVAAVDSLGKYESIVQCIHSISLFAGVHSFYAELESSLRAMYRDRNVYLADSPSSLFGSAVWRLGP
jgi:hypothetical protein